MPRPCIPTSKGAQQAVVIATVGWLALKVHEHEQAIRDLRYRGGGPPARQSWVEREHERAQAHRHGHGRE